MILSTPTLSLFNCSRLRGLTNTGAETAFSAEAVLAATDDKVLHPTPLQWNHEAGKRSRDVELLPSDLPEDVWVWPNPAHDHVFVALPEAHGVLRMMDIQGKEIIQHAVSTNHTTLSVHHLPHGLYMLVWEINGEVQGIEKVVVHK